MASGDAASDRDGTVGADASRYADERALQGVEIEVFADLERVVAEDGVEQRAEEHTDGHADFHAVEPVDRCRENAQREGRIRGDRHQLAAVCHARHGLADMFRLAEELRVPGREPEYGKQNSGGADHDDWTPVAWDTGYSETSGSCSHKASLKRTGAVHCSRRPTCGGVGSRFSAPGLSSIYRFTFDPRGRRGDRRPRIEDVPRIALPFRQRSPVARLFRLVGVVPANWERHGLIFRQAADRRPGR